MVTAGGLIFGGSISDNTMRAYDKDTGKVLWEMKLQLVLRAYRQFTKWPGKSISSSARARRLAHLQQLGASLLRRWRKARRQVPVRPKRGCESGQLTGVLCIRPAGYALRKCRITVLLSRNHKPKHRDRVQGFTVAFFASL